MGSRICKRCRRLPKDKISQLLAEDEIIGFLTQSKISQKNIQRIVEIQAKYNGDLKDKADLIFEISQVTPRKRHRVKIIKEKHPILMDKIKKSVLADIFYFTFGENCFGEHPGDFENLPLEIYEDKDICDDRDFEYEELPF